MHLPEELLEQLERGNVIPLVGSGINRGVLPTVAELAEELATRCDYPPDEPIQLARVAGYYLLTTHDRHGLIAFLRDRLDRPDVSPSTGHRLIAELKPRVVVTSCYDTLLARAAQDAELGYTPVIRNEEVAYGDDEKMMLVWLRGVLDRPDSLVVTADDHQRFLSGRESLSDVLRGEMARRTWLFVGFDLDEEWFPHYYDRVTQGLDHHRRRAYIVGRSDSAYTRAWWSARAQILDTDVEPFLSELVEQMAARRQPTRSAPGRAHISAEGEPEAAQAGIPLPERPYKLLDFYEASDAAIFFGREEETQAVTSLIHAHRLTLLYGASGTGKTSLLLAGVGPRLANGQSDYEVFHLRTLEEPGAVIRRAICRRCPDLAQADSQSLVELVDDAAAALGATLVLVLDQFEEFFIRFNAARRQAFIAELGALNDARDVPVKIVLSLREDWLAAVNEIRQRIPEIFYNDRRLLPLTRQQARQAITGPVERLGMRYAPPLVERLLDDLAEGGRESGSEHDGALVMPPQLQLVCDALYERALAQGRQTIAMAQYEQVGGAQGILVRYLEEALQEFQGRERQTARELLTALVTSQETKAGATVEELAAENGAPESSLKQILSNLIGQRLVRRLEDGNHYELTHDILASTIGGWIDEQERQRKRVREMVRREVNDWRHDPHVLLGRAKFEQVDALRDQLRLTVEEERFLLRAAIRYDHELPYWLGRAGEVEEQTAILLEMLEREPAARLTAAKKLADFPQERVASALAALAIDDDKAQVRAVAATSLGRLGVDSGVDYLLEVARTGRGERRARALGALATIRDSEPGRLDLAEVPLLPVTAVLAKMRLRRALPTIASLTGAGAIGGALALGVGLLPAVGLLTMQNGDSRRVFVSTLLLSFLGVVVGAMVGAGIGVGGALAGKRAPAGRIVGGVLVGTIGFAAVLAPLYTTDNPPLSILGAALFGAALSLGVALPMAAERGWRALIPAGGAIGGALSLPLWGIWTFPAFANGQIPLVLQFAAGGLTGLLLGTPLWLARREAARQAAGEAGLDTDARE